MEEPGPSLEDTGKGFTVRYRNRYLYSSRNPRAGPESIVSTTEVLPGTILFIPSPLLFHGFDDLFKKLSRDCHVLCVEADEKLMALSCGFLPPGGSTETAGKDRSMSFIRSAEINLVTEAIRGLRLWRFRRVRLLKLNAGYDLNASVYDAQFKAAEWVIRTYWQNRMTLVHMAPLWFSNLFKNLSMLTSGHTLSASAKGGTVVFAGAGESLEQALDLIREVRRHIFLLCADTALPALCSAGLKPDGVVVLEAQVHNAGDFIGCLDAPSLLFADLCSHPSLLRSYRGRKVFVSSAFAHTALFDRLKEGGLRPWTIPSLGSVGVAGLYIAAQLTTGAVIFTGLDFSYTLGKPHGRGTPTHIEALTGCCRFYSPIMYAQTIARHPFKIKTRADKFVHTDLVLQSYVENLNGVCGNTGRFFDLSTRGLPNNAKPLSVEKATRLIEKQGSSMEIAKSTISREQVRSFLRSEESLLTSFLEEDAASPEFRKRLQDLDYLYLHFPEYPNLDLTSLGVIKRLHQAASWYSRILDRILREWDKG